MAGKGGRREGSGRKSKAEEMGLQGLLDKAWPVARRLKHYSCYVAPTIAGLWTYKWFGVDAGAPLYQKVQGAEQDQFVVRDTVIG